MSQTIDIQTPSTLSSEDRATWTAIQSADRTFESPYFHIGWTDAVDAVRGGVRVAVVRENGEAVGFWPFEIAGGRAVAVGAPLNDYQGCISRPGVTVDPGKLLRAAGVSRWDFDHLLAAQPGMDDFEEVAECSPVMDLTGGFDAYLPRAGKKMRRNMRWLDGKCKAIREEHGTPRFILHDFDRRTVDALMTWKSAQYRATGLPDIFAADWTRNLLRHLLSRAETAEASDRIAFSGMLSTLHLDDRPIAAHFGLRCGPVVHWWFPSYDDEFGVYSPGWQLLVEVALAAEGLGIDRIDLGKGMSQFKKKAMTGSVPLREGTIDRSNLRRCLRRGGMVLKARLKQTPLRDYLRRPASWLFHRNIDGLLRASD